MLRATTPCTFSTSQLPKVFRTPQILTHFTSKSSKSASRHNAVHFFNISTSKSGPTLYLFTSKSASRHNGVQLFISHLPRCLRTRRFSEPTFQPSGATKPRKKTLCFATFLPFRAPASSFFWSFLFWLFSLLTAFSSLHIVGSLTSKLPSINIPWIDSKNWWFQTVTKPSFLWGLPNCNASCKNGGYIYIILLGI